MGSESVGPFVSKIVILLSKSRSWWSRDGAGDGTAIAENVFHLLKQHCPLSCPDHKTVVYFHEISMHSATD